MNSKAAQYVTKLPDRKQPARPVTGHAKDKHAAYHIEDLELADCRDSAPLGRTDRTMSVV